MKHNLKDVDSHFGFGENWRDYSAIIDEDRIAEAQKGILKLLSREQLQGRSFLDIGCGSGIHALAAARLGVREIVGIDIDENSVETTCATLERFGIEIPWRAETRSIFDITPEKFGKFDIVYSWGVLHHTGDMNTAIRNAAALVAKGGLFVFALYRRTRSDRFWIKEKRWYSQASEKNQKIAQQVYNFCYQTARRITGRSSKITRGMDYWHDVHDWLGGYPYETISAPEVEKLMNEIGFEKDKVFSHPMTLGIFGSGCDEYVYRASSH